MLTNMDKLYESVAANGPVCVGLDTEISYLPTTDTAKTAGENVLDFNRAQNPPCGLTPHVACPMALPENRLDLAVTAGEKKYAGAH